MSDARMPPCANCSDEYSAHLWRKGGACKNPKKGSVTFYRKPETVKVPQKGKVA